MPSRANQGKGERKTATPARTWPPAKSIRKQREGLSYRDCGNCIESETFYCHGSVGAAEAEVVLQGDIDLHFARGVRAVVQIALRILLENIDGRRRHLMMDSQYGQGRFETA